MLQTHVVWKVIANAATVTYDAATATGNPLYKFEAKKAIVQIKKWVSQGNPNLDHVEALLDAELAVLNGRHQIAKRRYIQAAASAEKNGFRQDHGLARERYGKFLLHTLKDRPLAISALKASIQSYADWGALGKVESMEEKHGKLLS